MEAQDRGGRRGMEEPGRHRLRHVPARRLPLVLRCGPDGRDLHQGRLAGAVGGQPRAAHRGMPGRHGQRGRPAEPRRGPLSGR